jgi:hypothetical protein
MSRGDIDLSAGRADAAPLTAAQLGRQRAEESDRHPLSMVMPALLYIMYIIGVVSGLLACGGASAGLL